MLLVYKNDKNITKFRSKMAKERQQVNCIIVFLGILFEPLKNFLLTCDSQHDYKTKLTVPRWNLKELL